MKIKVTDILNFIASNLGFTPTGGVTATNVQSAIAEIDSKKVTGPASATDNAIVRYDGTTGKVVQDSPASVDDAGGITGTSINTSGAYFLMSSLLVSKTGTYNIFYNTDGDGTLFFGGAADLSNYYDNNRHRWRTAGGSLTLLDLTPGGVVFDLSLFSNYPDDAAAAAGGVGVGQLYRNGSQVMIRVS